MTSHERDRAADEMSDREHENGETSSLELLDRARGGDREALNELIDTYRTYLLRVAGREMEPSLRQKLGASDLVQSACIEIQKRFADLRGVTEAEWRQWLKRLLIHDLHDARRRFQDAKKRDVSRERRLHQSNGQTLDPPNHERSPRAEAIAAEESALLEQAMGRLPAEHQQVLQLRNWEELSFREIGEQLQKSEDVARKLWARALARLQDEVDCLTGKDAEASR